MTSTSAREVVEQAGSSVERGAQETRRRAENGTGWYAWLARAGLVAAGVSYALVGVLAIGVAVDAGGSTTSREGALDSLARQPFGEVVLVLLAIGFAAYALWRLVQAIFERKDPSDGEEKAIAKKWGKRASYLGRTVIYGALAVATVRILFGTHGSSQNQDARQTTATLLEWPAGTWIVLAIGLFIAGVGLWNLYRGASKKFEEKWRTGEMSRRARAWASPVGVVGHLARGVVFALVGAFVVKAALEYDPKEAIGLDGALQKLAQADHGPWLLGATAAGLLAYGVFCFVDARYRDVSAGP